MCIEKGFILCISNKNGSLHQELYIKGRFTNALNVVLDRFEVFETGTVLFRKKSQRRKDTKMKRNKFEVEEDPNTPPLDSFFFCISLFQGCQIISAIHLATTMVTFVGLTTWIIL